MLGGGGLASASPPLRPPSESPPGRVDCTTTVIPAKAGIQRGGATGNRVREPMVVVRFRSCANIPSWGEGQGEGEQGPAGANPCGRPGRRGRTKLRQGSSLTIMMFVGILKAVPGCDALEASRSWHWECQRRSASEDSLSMLG